MGVARAASGGAAGRARAARAATAGRPDALAAAAAGARFWAARSPAGGAPARGRGAAGRCPPPRAVSESGEATAAVNGAGSAGVTALPSWKALKAHVADIEKT